MVWYMPTDPFCSYGLDTEEWLVLWEWAPMESWDGYRDISSPLVEGESSMLHVVLGVFGPWLWEAEKGTKESEYSLWPLP